MNPLYTVVVIAGLIVWMIYVAWCVWDKSRFGAHHTSSGQPIMVPLLVMVILCLVMPHLTIGTVIVGPLDKSMIVSESREIIAILDEGTYLWARDSRLADSSVQSYRPRHVRATITSAPITVNPSLLNWEITAKVQVGGTPQSGLDYLFSDWNGAVGERLEYWLWEFNNEHHGKFEQFYNPRDDRQQANLQVMFREYLGPQLEGTGITLVEVKFGPPAG